MLADDRVRQLADIIVNYSTKVKAGDHVLIRSTPLARPLIEELYRLIVRNGAHPVLQLSFDSLGPIFYEEASDEQLDYLSPITKFITENVDVMISIRAPENAREMTGVDPAKMRRTSVAARPLNEHIMGGGVRWIVCNYPTPSLAQEADMSLREYADFLFGATNIDWQSASQTMHKIKERFDRADVVRIVGKETDLTFSIKGRPGIVCDGEFNMPDGEVFYAPVENRTNGTIYFEWPAIYGGREVQGIRLTFKDGRVVEASAEQGEELLLQLLDSDEGARVLGEFGIGCNFGITRQTKDILFDEKIGGTIHLAVGSGYPESGSQNKSAIHWDMVKDLRGGATVTSGSTTAPDDSSAAASSTPSPDATTGASTGGEIYLDGELVQKDGRFLFLDE